MAELNLFHYNPQKSIIHDMDGRIKLMCMILFAVATGMADQFLDLLVLTTILLLAYIGARLSLKKFFTGMRYFLFFTAIVIIVHAFTVPGKTISNLPVHGMTWEGLQSGLWFGWRLVLMVLLGLLITGTTPLSLFKNVIEWYLRPIPCIPEARVATMFSLTFVLVPLVFDQASEILEAQRSRCIDGRKNPIARMAFLLGPLVLHTLMRADEMVLAMESRCYSEVRTGATFKTTLNDWIIMLFSGLICLVISVRFLLHR